MAFTTTTRTRFPATMRRAIGVGMLCALGALLSGCSNADKQQQALYEQENMELRNRNEQLEAALRDSESQRSLLEEERDRLMAQSRSQPAGRTGGTGFEGMSGVGVSVRAGDIVVDVAGDVLFDSGQVTLKQNAKQTLDRIANVINTRYSNAVIRIEGHTDTDPIRRSSWKTNERLGAERAMAVQDYLAGRGVNKSRTYIASWGPARPKSTKAASRRVEIVILGGG